MMDRGLFSFLCAVGLFLGMILFLELGRRLGRRHAGKEDQPDRAGLGAVEGAVFALLGLLIAFTFSGAATRFDARKQLIIEEANAIGTAWLRLDLLPAAAQPELHDLFRRYLDARLSIYQKLPDMDAARGELEKAKTLQTEIWARAVAACQQTATPVAAQMIPALNQMFDIATTRTAVVYIHPPLIVFIMLGALALMGSLLTGYAMAGSRSRNWVHVIGFAFVMAVTLYVILDLEFPRLGLIRVDAADRLFLELRESMK